jgi:glycosyltransferase A (GT-A) superfamily protein (DUF2064 family)
MVKVPYPGRCKTRLCPPLTEREAASLYACFLDDLAREAPGWDLDADLVLAWADDDRRAPPQVTSSPPEIASSPPDPGTDEPLPEPLAARFGQGAFRPLKQRGPTLTARMEAVFVELARRGYASVVMRNSDSPHLPEETMREAFAAIDGRPGSVVLGPDLDGGYYLVGMSGGSPRIFPAVMSTETVLAQTVELARAAGRPVHTLSPQLDIDTPEDLATFWLEFGNRADVRHWATWRELDEHPAWERFGELSLGS